MGGKSHLMQVLVDGDAAHEGVLHVEGRPLGDVGPQPRHLPRVHLGRVKAAQFPNSYFSGLQGS